MASKLFLPIEMRGLTLTNRIVVAPMTQFSADDGVAGDWHFVHLGQFAMSGAGLILTESCYIESESRNATSCLSLYTDEQESGIGRVIAFIHGHGTSAFGVQLCHAGRKASSKSPAEGGGQRSLSEGGHQPVAPSAVPISPNLPPPRALEINEIHALVDTFAAAAQRAHRAGSNLIELHGAHGYLIHQFLSPISNKRSDQYGGSLENRMRFALEVYEAVRGVFPDDKPVGIRLSATDWVPGGWDVDSTVRLVAQLRAMGCDYAHISSGGLSPDQQITTGPGYQAGFAAAVKREVDIPVIAVGQISEPLQAESILQSGQADLVALARPMLFNPRWTWHAAHELGEQTFYPEQYVRAQPHRWGRGQPVAGNFPVDKKKSSQ